MDKPNMMVKLCLLEAGITQRELAKLMGKSESTVKRWLRKQWNYEEQVKCCNTIKTEQERRETIKRLDNEV